MTARAEVDRVGKGENSFSSFSLFCFVSFCFVTFYFSRALSTSRKKKGCGQANKKKFFAQRLSLILLLTAIKYCYKVSFLHTQEIVLWHFS